MVLFSAWTDDNSISLVNLTYGAAALNSLEMDGEIGYSYSSDDGLTFTDSLLGAPHGLTDRNGKGYEERKIDALPVNGLWSLVYLSNDPDVKGSSTSNLTFILQTLTIDLGRANPPAQSRTTFTDSSNCAPPLPFSHSNMIHYTTFHNF